MTRTPSMTAPHYQGKLTEQQFQAQILAMARALGWAKMPLTARKMVKLEQRNISAPGDASTSRGLTWKVEAPMLDECIPTTTEDTISRCRVGVA